MMELRKTRLTVLSPISQSSFKNMVYRSNLGFLLILISFISSCGTGSGEGKSYADKIKYRQYFNNGRRIYLDNCSNCHQKDGTGLARLYPPIKDSDFFKKDPGRTVCIIRNGQTGKITVNGITYNQPMPANPELSNLEIAELTTYLYGMWGDEDRLFSTNQVVDILKSCK